MAFNLKIATGNSAFSDGESEFAGPELARILRTIADRIEEGIPTGDSSRVLDINGNDVGAWSYEWEHGGE